MYLDQDCTRFHPLRAAIRISRPLQRLSGVGYVTSHIHEGVNEMTSINAQRRYSRGTEARIQGLERPRCYPRLLTCRWRATQRPHERHGTFKYITFRTHSHMHTGADMTRTVPERALALPACGEVQTTRAYHHTGRRGAQHVSGAHPAPLRALNCRLSAAHRRCRRGARRGRRRR